jgi:hypothetical protein
MEAAQSICEESPWGEVIGYGPTISLDTLKGTSGMYSIKAGGEFLLRCVREMGKSKTRLYAVSIGLSGIVDGDEDASPECLSFELFPGCTPQEVADFLKHSGGRGEELVTAIDLPKAGEPVLVISYSGDNFPDPTEDLQLFPNAWAIVTNTRTIVHTRVGSRAID